jgi:hypothetical protein
MSQPFALRPPSTSPEECVDDMAGLRPREPRARRLPNVMTAVKPAVTTVARGGDNACTITNATISI